MLSIEYKPGTHIVLRPTPFISITQNAIRNKTGMLGSYYDITLNGTILSDEGSPFYSAGAVISDPSTPWATSYNRPAHESVGIGSAMASIIHKQNLIREIFKKDGQLFELLPVKVDDALENDGTGPETPVLRFYPTVQSINFEEGLYVNTCKYTINLRAEVLLDQANKIISDGLVNSTHTPTGTDGQPYRNNGGNRLDLASALAASGFIDDYSESWSIDVEEGKGVTRTDTPYSNGDISSIRTYRLTRNISATGRTMYYPSSSIIKRKEAWEQAKNYVYLSILKDTTPNTSADNSTGYEQFPEYTLGPYFGSGYLNIAKDSWGGYNHLRTESIDVTAGTFTLTDVWLLSSGSAYEDYRMSLSKGSDNGLYKVSIDGNIKGLSSAHAGHGQYGGTVQSNQPALNPIFNTATNTQYQNALYKWHQVSNYGQYGPSCHLFKRSQSLTHQGLNHVPLSIALGSNEFTGEITYNVEYDSRPTNLVSGTLSESVTYSDTYPGDVFAVIPVIGRQTGPVLQYIGGRTEYQRNLSIDLVMDKYYASGTTGTLKDRIRQLSVLSKPSLNEPFKSQINAIIHAYSPINENGIRKYFVNPPTESWDAYSGRYSLQINWTYELNR
jgi:hypothetical protein